MAKSNINKKRSFDITGMLRVEEAGNIVFEVEDIEEPVALENLIKDFDGYYCKLAINYTEGV